MIPLRTYGEWQIQSRPAMSALTDLAKKSGEGSVTVYLDCRRAAAEPQRLALTLKSLVQSVRGKARLPEQASRDLQSLAEPGPFWTAQSSGLAIFHGPETRLLWKLPFPVNDRLFVNDRFTIHPLVLPMKQDEQFILVTLSMGKLRVFRGNRHELVLLRQIEERYEQALGLDEFPESLQAHSTSTPTFSTGRGDQVFHSHGGSTRDKRSNVIELLARLRARDVEGAVDGPERLVYAGDLRILPPFKAALTKLTLIEPPIGGIFDETSETELLERAWSVVEAELAKRRQALLDAYHQGLGTGWASSDPEEVIRMAESGGVDTLLVGPMGNNGDKQAAQQVSALLERAVRGTVEHGGDIERLDEGETRLGALFRWPAAVAPEQSLDVAT